MTEAQRDFLGRSLQDRNLLEALQAALSEEALEARERAASELTANPPNIHKAMQLASQARAFENVVLVLIDSVKNRGKGV